MIRRFLFLWMPLALLSSARPAAAAPVLRVSHGDVFAAICDRRSPEGGGSCLFAATKKFNKGAFEKVQIVFNSTVEKALVKKDIEAIVKEAAENPKVEIWKRTVATRVLSAEVEVKEGKITHLILHMDEELMARVPWPAL